MKNIKKAILAVNSGNFTAKEWNTYYNWLTFKEVSCKIVCGILYTALGLLGSAVLLGTVGTIIDLLVH